MVGEPFRNESSSVFMDREDVQERTPEGIREEFHERVERLRGQARNLKTLLEHVEHRHRHRLEEEFVSSIDNVA